MAFTDVTLTGTVELQPGVAAAGVASSGVEVFMWAVSGETNNCLYRFLAPLTTLGI